MIKTVSNCLIEAIDRLELAALRAEYQAQTVAEAIERIIKL